MRFSKKVLLETMAATLACAVALPAAAQDVDWTGAVIGGTIGFVVQLALFAAFFPAIIDLVELAERGSHVDPDAALASLQASLSQPGTVIGLIVSFILLYAIQVMLEAVWHSIGAYNAVRARSGGEGEQGDAPKLAADHPMGASPSEG